MEALEMVVEFLRLNVYTRSKSFMGELSLGLERDMGEVLE